MHSTHDAHGASEATPLSNQELAGITDTVVRNGFVRKVFSILGVQLAITTAIAGAAVAYGESLMRTNPATVLC